MRDCKFIHISIFQAVKPKSGVFCFLITEARETTALEMPDHENTFVLKVSTVLYCSLLTLLFAYDIVWSVTYVLGLQAENNMEYVIEAHDTDDMRSWLATIKYCMRTMLPSQDGRWVMIDVIFCVVSKLSKSGNKNESTCQKKYFQISTIIR